MRIFFMSIITISCFACHDTLTDSSCSSELFDCSDQGVGVDLGEMTNQGDLSPLETHCTQRDEVSCDGLDNDCDGLIDESYVEELSENQKGVCEGALKLCVEGAYSEPDLRGITHYEVEELSCDGLDNDCDGLIDELLSAPLADLQLGLCEGAVKVCHGVEGWSEPDYQLIEGYRVSDAEGDDGVDNDCDGAIDEGFCGDGVINRAEECDDGNLETERCQYGETSCVVCSALCTEMRGEPGGFCGDGVVNGHEECDGEPWCQARCSGTPPPCASSVSGCPDLNFIPLQGGTFHLRATTRSDDSAHHTVALPPFEMMRGEITVAHYRLCVDAGACTEPFCYPSDPYCTYALNAMDHPVTNITWYQAMEFAAWVGARLPTEAEWAYAARNEGREVTYPWGNEPPTCTLTAYNSSECGSGTSPVCTHPSGNTEQGLCDMVGNVSEWLQDEYDFTFEDYPWTPHDGSGSCQGGCPENAGDANYDADDQSDRVVRGGSWGDTAFYLSLMRRDYSDPNSAHNGKGARLSRSIIWINDGECGDGELNGTEQCDGEPWCSARCTAPPCAFSSSGCPSLELVRVQGGMFEMGSNQGSYSEQPVHYVTVPDFEMTQTEVTLSQYRMCVEAGWCRPPRTDAGTECNWNQSDREDHPVNCIDWGQARTFAKWFGEQFDLPTEAEWEYAARGGEGFNYAGSNDINEVGWYQTNSEGSSQPVATKQPNGYGLYDMSGNIEEWVLDEYQGSYRDASSDGSEAWGRVPSCSGICDSLFNRVSRGGSWNSSESQLRVSSRSSALAPLPKTLGFRLRKRLP